MIVGSDGNEDPIVVDGTEVEHVTQFNFLGSLITTSSGCSIQSCEDAWQWPSQLW